MEANSKIQIQLTELYADDKYADLEMFVNIKDFPLQVTTKSLSKISDTNQTMEERAVMDGSVESIVKSAERIKAYTLHHEIRIRYRNMSFWNNMPKRTIPTVGSAVKEFFMGKGKKERVDVLKDLTGQILPGTMTLVVGPPGCGKTTLLKSLAGQLTIGSAHLEGEILYNDDPIDCGKFKVGKVAAYCDERDQHHGALTVRETLDFAWRSTTGGHHSYNVAKDDESARKMDEDDSAYVKVQNTLRMLGLYEVSDTFVGDALIRGVSGGEKRRVTLGEMLVLPRKMLFLDVISNGLDAATTNDIVQALKYLTTEFGNTTVVSLLQPAPDVFYSFVDVIVMADGQIIYHGPTSCVADYFQNLGYFCPDNVDIADFLQELPTTEGRRFTTSSQSAACECIPFGTDALVMAWKESKIFKKMMEEMDVQVRDSDNKSQWPAVYSERYPGSFWSSFLLCLDREIKLLMRNKSFLMGRLAQVIIVGALSGSVFYQLDVTDSNSMSGILFFSALTGAFSAMSMLPIIFAQRAVFYKQSKSLFFPTNAYVLAQTIATYPLMILETIVYISIVYWFVGLSEDDDGSRFFTYLLVVFVFTLSVSQFFRLVASVLSTDEVAQPVAGFVITLMILFCGFIIPKSNIPPAWMWFYYINPVAYVIQSVMINEFLAPDYDFLVCANTACLTQKRFGDVVLNSRGLPIEQEWVWYGVTIMVAIYLVLLFFTVIAMQNIRLEGTPIARIMIDYAHEASTTEESEMINILFEPMLFAFKDVWYSVTLPTGESLDLLQGVSGFFEPGSLTALMGSSGAGKTTLLDVLSGRKNTGTMSGEVFVNGKPVSDTFKHVMGYVEQFDTLAPNDTAREAVEFSAALRLPSNTPSDIRAQWVTTVLTMLELIPLENTLVGTTASGGMSCEQKKRVSIAVELAANSTILFLDEPTSGLDSRSAQVVIRCIKRVAASGRTVVCTIHQPSTVIFEAFESLLLLRRGGQTVYFGELGDKGSHLIHYFEQIPGVEPMPKGTNPATWMLDVIGAGTAGKQLDIDMHHYYNSSLLCKSNTAKNNTLCPGDESVATDSMDGSSWRSESPSPPSPRLFMPFIPFKKNTHELGLATEWHYNASYWVQFKVLYWRFLVLFWRYPTYNFGRVFSAVLFSLVFSSASIDQEYITDVDCISRVALIYMTTLFVGCMGRLSVEPVMYAERPSFYREQYSGMYDVKLYVLAATLVEIPYLIVSSVAFLVPFFWIVGFDRGDATIKFFWYWAFNALFSAAMVFLGHFFAAAFPSPETAQIVGGMIMTLYSLFCGFMIVPSAFPDFWIFMYWLSPIHYVLEGVVTTQFNGDKTLVSITGTTEVVTANTFISNFYSDWHYSARGYDILALCAFIVALRLATFLSLKYLCFNQR